MNEFRFLTGCRLTLIVSSSSDNMSENYGILYQIPNNFGDKCLNLRLPENTM